MHRWLIIQSALWMMRVNDCDGDQSSKTLPF